MAEALTLKRKRFPGLALVGGFLVMGGAGLSMAALQHVPKVKPGTMLKERSLSGLTQAQAEAALKDWFEDVKGQELQLVSEYLKVQPEDVTPEALGASLDVSATMSQVGFEDFWAYHLRRVSGGVAAALQVEPILSFDDKKIEALGDFIEENMKAGAPATAKWRSGAIVLSKEVPGMKLDLPKLSEAVFKASMEGEETEIPMTLAPKKVPDEELAKITEVLSSYSTKFNNGQLDRSANIRLAATILDGRVLMPGESFSFNRLVGRRTSAGGFKRAGVLVNGRKEYDIGGGICQVSTTLYNAAVFADLKITARSPHSRPVPYVPLGRDAAVSFPNPDLAFTNNLDAPIALSAIVGRGVIEFKVLGQKEDVVEIKIVQGGVSSASNGVKYVQDDTLGYGVEKVIESGSDRRTMTTYKITTKGGREVSRETLNTSVYRGSPRIIARNSKAKPPVTQEGATGGGATPSQTDGSGSTSGPEPPPDRDL